MNLFVTRILTDAISVEEKNKDETADHFQGLGEELALVSQATVSPLLTYGDRSKLAQVVRNLISNALKFTPVGGDIAIKGTYSDKDLTLSSGLSEVYPSEGRVLNRGFVTLTVKDSGAGLSESDLKELFQEGKQFSANKLQGSGLGLYIAKQLVELHHGTLTATSEGLGKGAEFVMKIPAFYREIREGEDTNIITDICKHSESESIATGTENDIELGNMLGVSSTHGTGTYDSSAESNTSLLDDLERVDLSQLSILVVDDATSTRKIMHRMLKSKVLLDFEMPNLNGPETVKELRKRGYTLPVIGVTGNVLKQDMEYFISCGANDVVSKPLKMKQLDVCIKKQWLKSRHVIVKTECGKSAVF